MLYSCARYLIAVREMFSLFIPQECNYGSHEFSSDEDFQTPPMSPTNTPPSPLTHSPVSNNFHDKPLEKEVPGMWFICRGVRHNCKDGDNDNYSISCIHNYTISETSCSVSPVVKSDANVSEDQPLTTKPLKEQLGIVRCHHGHKQSEYSYCKFSNRYSNIIL